MNRARLWSSVAAALMLAGAPLACGGGTDNDSEGLGVLNRGGIQGIAFISRSKRTNVGDVFQYTSFSVEYGSANIMGVSTLSGGGDIEPITPFGTGEWPAADIMAMDVSFDGQEIAFSARLEGDDSYNLYRIKIDGTNPEEPGQKGPALIHTGPYDSVFPVYLPNDRIFFMTNETPAPGIRQFRDEYERGTTAQAATINKRGGDLKLGPRNLSHRVSPSLASLPSDNGQTLRAQIVHTNWDHVVDVNEGNLMLMNPDMTGGAEFFGKEGSGVSNSYLKARQVNANQFLAISTARERTFQSGAIILIDKNQNEANAVAEILTPDVPRDREPSFDRVGRYYDAYPVTDSGGTLTHILTSWANGPVQSDVAAGGMSEEGFDYGEGAGPPDFGVFVLDPKTGKRLPIFNDANMWDVSPMAIGTERPVPISPSGAVAETPEGTSLIGALNVNESSLGAGQHGQAIHRVRILEGFSTEEGVPDDFGLTEADGAILIGEAKVASDGSFAAFVPEDRPIHLQTLDMFGMNLTNEDRWFSSAAGEQRFCGGCHEERGATQVVNPGLSEAFGQGPSNFALPHDQRRMPIDGSEDWGLMAQAIAHPEDVPGTKRMTGLPWNIALQSAIDSANCSGCHEGTPGPANPTVSITDTNSDMPQSTEWTFDLRGDIIEYTQGMMTGLYTRSHISLLIVAGMMNEPGVEVVTDPAQPYQAYMVPQNSRESVFVQYINPEQVYPTLDTNVRAFTGTPKASGGTIEADHPNANTPGFVDGTHRPFTTYEKYLFIIAADAGGQYYYMENAPGQDGN